MIYKSHNFLIEIFFNEFLTQKKIRPLFKMFIKHDHFLKRYMLIKVIYRMQLSNMQRTDSGFVVKARNRSKHGKLSI